MKQIPLDKLEYILRIIKVKYECICQTNTPYILEACDDSITEFEKKYNVSFINDYMFINEDK